VDEVRSALDKAKAEGDVLLRAKKSLEAQLDRLTDELGEDGKNVAESRKTNKKLEASIERVRPHLFLGVCLSVCVLVDWKRMR
jgi:cell division septum initiation protein DivIVA